MLCFQKYWMQYKIKSHLCERKRDIWNAVHKYWLMTQITLDPVLRIAIEKSENKFLLLLCELCALGPRQMHFYTYIYVWREVSFYFAHNQLATSNTYGGIKVNQCDMVDYSSRPWPGFALTPREASRLAGGRLGYTLHFCAHCTAQAISHTRLRTLPFAQRCNFINNYHRPVSFKPWYDFY